MAKWKEPTTEVVTTPSVDPRARMKEIRAEVKAFLKGDTLGLAHLGDLPSNMEDARRVIIAVQDLHEIEREKHRKATLRICKLVAILDGMSKTQQKLMTKVNQRDLDIYQLQQLNNLNQQEITALRREVDHMRQQRDAVLTTMKLQSNMAMARPDPMVVPREAFGESNRGGPMTLGQDMRAMSQGRAR